MRKVVALFIAGCFLLTPVYALSAEEDWSANLGLFLGYKLLDDSDWDPVDVHGSFGVLYDFSKVDWPINVACDILYSKEEDSDADLGDAEAETTEVHFGIRQYFNMGTSMQPYLGAGVAYSYTDWDDQRFGSDSDSTFGAWINGGIRWLTSEHVSLGLDLRYSTAEPTIHGRDLSGGLYAGLGVGYRW